MDKIIRISVELIIILLVVFVASRSYAGFIENAYRTLLSSTYDYRGTITTDFLHNNATLFIPVKVDPDGNSPIVVHYSVQEIWGRPADWKVTWFDTGKTTLPKITTPVIITPKETSPSHQYTIRLSITADSKTVIDTKTPVEIGVIFRPVQDIQKVNCSAGPTKVGGENLCSEYVIPVYVDRSVLLLA